MATFTPTASSTVIAGGCLAVLMWTIINHIDSVLAPFGFRQPFSRLVRGWINRNKVLSLCITEVINLGHAGLSPLGTTFAIGATIVNGSYILLVNPYLCWRDRRKNPLEVVR